MKTSNLRAALALGVALWLGALAMRPAKAFLPPDALAFEMAWQSDLVLVGTLHSLKKGRARFTVEQVLKGADVAPEVEVAPVTNSMHERNFREGETLVLFLKRGDALTIVAHGWGALTFRPETKTATLDAIKHLLTLPLDGEALDRAMLALALSDNFLLREQSHRHLVTNLNRGQKKRRFDAELIELLKRPEADVREAALQALQFSGAANALPLIIEASRSENERLVQAASMALAHYDAPESVAALIALTRHANPEIRMRALIDLSGSGRAEAKAASIVLLDDSNPRVRALAPVGLIGWLRSGAPEIVPKLIQMLNDPNVEVQAGAASALGESGSALAVAPLFAVLKRRDSSEPLERSAMSSLSQIHSRLDAPARVLSDADLSVVIAVMERGRGFASSHAVSLLARNPAPQAVEALRRAAQNHPLQDVREYAKRSLAQRVLK